MALISSIGEVNLDALDKSIADTAVDIFVYDTRKDSDGGKWRKRTKKTSWYNEELNTATRGSRREFPAVAVIVAESNQVTIYDGDDPDLPMWMVFDATTGNVVRYENPLSIKCINGKLVVAQKISIGGLSIIDFIVDAGEHHNTTDGYIRKCLFIVNRNSGNITSTDSSSLLGYTSGMLVGKSNINDVAMTVLPNAPIDDATGLPIPTIAVACGTAGSANGGVSIIKDDGTVIDIIATTGAGGYASYNVEFGRNNELIHTQAYNRAYSNINIFDNIPSSDISATTTYTDARSYPYINSVPNIRGGVNGAENPYLHYVSNSSGDNIAFGFKSTNAKLSLLSDNKTAGTDATKSMVAYITSDYNTGWMHGDIKGAFLSDTDATNVTGSELVTNGTFDTDTTGWSGYIEGTYTTLSIDSGRLKVEQIAGTSAFGFQAVTTEIGKTYVVTADFTGAGSAGRLLIGTSSINGDLYAEAYSSATRSVYATFTATTTTTYISAHSYASAGNYVLIDNVTCRIADPDRSVNDNGLQVFGTITKSPVATGSDLVAYSGFSESNYLEQPYNSALDFETGDFCYMGWFKYTANGADQYLFDRSTDGTTSEAVRIALVNTNLFIRVTSSYSNTNALGRQVPQNTWNHVALLRRSGKVYLYFNGKEEIGGANSTGSVSTNYPLTFGTNNGIANNSELNSGSIALWKISASAPTAEQIKKIYEDEKVLFQENAACTLYGSSDAVTALAYDDKTNLLHVGTSSGRSDFKGLRRINNTTTGITTAISASNRLIAEQ